MEKPPINENEPDPTRQFIEANQELINQAQRCFGAETFTKFLELKPALLALAEKYKRDLSPRLIREIVGDEYTEKKEDELRNLSATEGLYLPLDQVGGGDFWTKSEISGEVGEVEIVDAMGHGATALYHKELITRWLELRRETPLSTDNLFVELDNFLNGLPLASQLDLMRAEVLTEKGEEPKLKIEMSGNLEFFIRHQDGSGRVEYGVVPETAERYQDKNEILSPLAIERRPVLGYGLLENQPFAVPIVNLPPNADIYLMSDGLFESLVDGEFFQDLFPEFCEQHRNLSSEDFQTELFAIAEQQASKGKLEDDITALVIRVRQNKTT